MDATHADDGPTKQLADAEMAHNAASTLLAASLRHERDLLANCTEIEKEMPIWRAASATRLALDGWDLPRVLPVAVFPLPVTLMGFIAANELTGFIGVAAVIALVLFIASTVGMAFLCLFPDDETVARQPARLREAQERLAASQHRRQQAQTDVGHTFERLQHARAAVEVVEAEKLRLRQQKEKSVEAWLKAIEGKCHALLRRGWRDMRGEDFEHFLAEVLATVGYEVHMVGQSGDQGVDLIAVKDGTRIAVQAKGYAGSVGNFAVQEVYAGMTHYACHACAVITNSTFTSSAVSLASSTRCLLVHEANFPDFVYGRVQLTGECHSGSGPDN